MVELVEHRTTHGKLFKDGNEFVQQLTQAALHVPKDPEAWMRGEGSSLDDVDLSWDIKDNVWHLKNAWYDLIVNTDNIGYSYRDKTNGARLKVRLAQIGNIKLSNTLIPYLEGSRICWDDVVPGVDIYLEIRPASVEIFKRIRLESSPREFVWELQESLPPVIGFSTLTHGWDGKTNPLHLVYNIGPEKFIDGMRQWSVTEIWTGQTIIRDKHGKAQKSKGVIYPILIDFNVSVSITNNADDGRELSTTGYWNPYGTSLYHNNTGPINDFPGFRFRNLTIPQGATISSATLTYYVVSVSGPTGTGAVLYGWATDSAPGWASSAGPIQMTPTTANVALTFGSGTATGSTPINVTSIVQEIINRSGWASGNNIAFGAKGTLGGNYAGATIYDFNSGTGANLANLNVTYTIGAVANPFIQYDLSNPTLNKFSTLLRGFIESADTQLFGQDQFFTSPGMGPDYDYPNPIILKIPIDNRTWIQTLDLQLLGKDLFFTSPGKGPTYDWSNPIRLTPRPIDIISWFQNLLENTLGAIQNPFYLGDWPNPLGYKYPIDLRTFIQQLYSNAGKDTFFGGQGQPLTYDWPNPLITKRLPENQIINLLENTLAILISPFNQFDWPNPKSDRYPRELLSHIRGIALNLLGQDAFFNGPGIGVNNIDWRNPKIGARIDQANLIIQNLVINFPGTPVITVKGGRLALDIGGGLYILL